MNVFQNMFSNIGNSKGEFIQDIDAYSSVNRIGPIMSKKIGRRVKSR